jgi:hypothetical protein
MDFAVQRHDPSDEYTAALLCTKTSQRQDASGLAFSARQILHMTLSTQQ